MAERGVNKSMFEQSILLPDPAKKRWTLAASILVEVSALSVLMLLPLIYTERLGLGWIQSSMPHAPSPPRSPMPKRMRDMQQVLTHTAPHVFDLLVAPRRIPATIALIDIDQPVPPSCPNCASGLVTSDSVNNSLAMMGPNTIAPPPKPQPKPAEVKKPIEAAPTAPIRVSIGAQEAKIIRRVIPAYPTLAKQARVQGTVRLLGVISTEGRIEKLQVISGHPLLVQAAVDAVKQWTYRPTLLNGQPVEVMAPIDVNFILSN